MKHKIDKNMKHKIDKKLLLPLLAIESESHNSEAMETHITSVLATVKGVTWFADEWGNIIASKGDGKYPPCVVAHMDTVHRITGDGLLPVECNGKVTGINPVTMKQSGIGGDDKCGIYAALIMLRELPNIKAVFTVDEEVGAIGASRLELEHLDGIGFLVQADRRGNVDMVTRACGTMLASPQFIAAAKGLAKGHGYRRCEDGGLTDVQELVARDCGVSALNLSAGYHRPHQDSEYIDLAHLATCVEFMLTLAKALGGRHWVHVNPPRPKYPPTKYSPVKYMGSGAQAAEIARLEKYWDNLGKGAYITQADLLAREARIAMEEEAERLGAFGMPDFEPDHDSQSYYGQ
jgi:putative aminopeptidase FrvX